LWKSPCDAQIGGVAVATFMLAVPIVAGAVSQTPPCDVSSAFLATVQSKGLSFVHFVVLDCTDASVAAFKFRGAQTRRGRRRLPLRELRVPTAATTTNRTSLMPSVVPVR
jgi:hypothetical protein